MNCCLINELGWILVPWFCIRFLYALLVFALVGRLVSFIHVDSFMLISDHTFFFFFKSILAYSESERDVTLICLLHLIHPS